jgi:protein tyrosine phosphatase (PTP) superfamily phosphohydrolase (DUF442 family)
MTSALPTPEDFPLMAAQGYEIVISLCQEIDTEILEDEDGLVSRAGMRYIHLPVTFAAPTLEDYELLRDILRSVQDRKVWLHCARNWRVSAFMTIYHIVEMSMTHSEAEEIAERIWRPDEIWQALIDEAIEKYAYQYL